MKSKIAILLMPFLVFTFFKENLMKSKIAMFNLNSKSTFTATLLALILGASVFLAGSVYAQKTVIQFDSYQWQWPPAQKLIKKTIEEYERLNSHIDIQMVGVGWGDAPQSLLVRAAAGDAPDVMWLDWLWYYDLAQNGVMADLTKLATRKELADLDPVVRDTGKVGDAVYTIPWMIHPFAMWANVALLNKYDVGIAETWDEVYENAIKVRDKSNGEDFYFWVPTWNWTLDFHNIWEPWNFGVFPLENLAEGEIGLNTPEAKVWLEWRRKMAKAGLLYGPGEDIGAPRERGFAMEKLAMHIDGIFLLGNMLQANPDRWGGGRAYDGSLTMAKIPVLNKGDVPLAPPSANMLAIAEQSKVKNEAWEFAYWFTTSRFAIDTMWELNQSITTFLPVQKDMYKPGGPYDNTIHRAAKDNALPFVRMPKLHKMWTRAAPFVIDAANKAVFTDKPIDEILAEAEANIKIVTRM